MVHANVYLVRHGETPTTGKVLPGRAPGLHLSARGREQAKEVAAQFSDVHAVYCSPLERTRETAAPLCEKFGLEPMLCDGILEADFGSWTGASLQELSALPEWKVVQQRPSEFRFPGGESFAEMQARVVGGLEEIARRHPGETVVCFSHADPIKAALTHYAGKPLDEFQQAKAAPGSVTRVQL